MPLSDKNIVITPNVGQNADPTIVFTGANTANTYMINVRVYPTSSGTLSFEGGAGQLFSISNTLTGTIFSVNDISGIPSIEVIDTGVIKLAQYNGNVTIGSSNTVNASSNLIGALMVNGGIAATGNIYSGALYITGPTSNGITFSDFSTLITSNNITAAFIQANNAASFANGAFTSANNLAAVNTTQNTNITSAQSFANGAFVTANSASSFANGAFTAANVSQAINNTQNTNISSAQSFANGAFVTANSASSFANGAFTLANNTTGVDNTQNTNISSAQSYANGAFTQANNAASFANSAFNMANNSVITLTSNNQNQITTNNTLGNIVFGLAATGVVAGSYAYYTGFQVDSFGRLTTTTASSILEPMGNSAYAFANTGYTQANNAASFANGAFTLANTGVGVDNTQNTNISSAQSFANGAFTTANVAFGRIQITANTGDLLANGVNTPVTGNILLGLATTTVSAATYGGASQIPVFTVDTKGRLTYAANVALTSTVTSIQANTNGGLFANGTQGVSQSGTVLLSVSNTHITNAVTANTLMDLQLNSLGVGTAASGTAGEIRATNQITAYYSDQRLKENIKLIDNALDKVNSISGITYNANDLAETLGYNDKSEQVGVLAQELEKVLPHVVKLAPFDTKYIDGKEISLTGENYKTVQYERIIPLLIEAIKELNKKVKKLEGN